MAPVLMDGLFTDLADSQPIPPIVYWSGPRLAMRVTLMDICGILAIGLNVLNLAVIRDVTCFQDATKLFLSVLAVVDLSSGCLTIITETASHWTDMTERVIYFCEITLTTSVFLMLSSLFLLSCLSIDRLLAITRPLRYPNLMDYRRAALLATFALCLACLLSVGLMSRKSPLDNVYFDKNYRFCSTRGFDSDIQFALALGGTIAIFVIICTTVINAKLLWVALKQSRRNRTVMVKPSPTTNAVDNVTGKPIPPDAPVVNIQISKWQELKALRTVLTMTFAMYVAYLPLVIHVTRFAIGLDPYGIFYEFVAYLMIYNNAWFNPLIYLFSNKGYRKTAIRFWRRKLNKENRICSICIRACSQSRLTLNPIGG